MRQNEASQEGGRALTRRISPPHAHSLM